MLVWQQRAASRAELNLRLFEELQKVLTAASDVTSRTAVQAHDIPANVRLYHYFLGKGRTIPFPTRSTFDELSDDALTRLAAVRLMLEAHDIVSEHFDLFRRALGRAQQDVTSAYVELEPLLYQMLSKDIGATTVAPPSHAEFEELTDKCDRYWKAMSTVSSYLEDIKIEIQNVLLGSIFSRRVHPRRGSVGAGTWVLRTDDPAYVDSLREHFFEDRPDAVGAARAARRWRG